MPVEPMTPRRPVATARRRPAAALLGVVALALAVALTGCSGSGSGAGAKSGAGSTPTPPASSAGGIASLRTSTAAPTSTSSTGTDALEKEYGSAARLRLDMSQADEDRAYQPFDRCVADHTPRDLPPAAQGSDGLGAASDQQTQADDAAQALCRPLAPKPPWEYDRDNPDAERFVEKIIDCLASEGVPGATVASDDGSGRVSVAFSQDTAKGMRLYPVCERKVAEEGR